MFKRNGVSLSQFVHGIVKALTDGQQAIPHAREEHLEHHMEKVTDDDDNTVYKPKTITIQLDENRRMTVPTYTLAQVNTIGISGAKIKCNARIVDLEQAEMCSEMTCGERHAVFTVLPGMSGKHSFEMEIDFQQRKPSESESRLMEGLDSVVSETTKTQKPKEM